MKVLVIIGSPRKKGNSYKVTKRLEEKMKELGKIEFSYLFLKDANIKHCRGCFTCISRGEDLCPIKDDRDKILEQMVAADGLILVSPAYYYNVTTLMKNFIDRTAYLAHRPAFVSKPIMAITTSAGAGLKETLKYLGMVASGWETNITYKLGVWTPLYALAPKEVNKIRNNINRAAGKFFNVLHANEHFSPSLGSLLHFRIIRYHAILEKEYFPADYNYFKGKGLLDNSKKYYIDTKINPFRNMIAGLIEKIMRPQMRKTLMKNN